VRRRNVALLASAFVLAVAVQAALAPGGAAVPDIVRVPRARPHPRGTPPENASFSHWRHGAYRCFACHPAIFPQAPEAFTHADMSLGRYCGRCHDGAESRAVRDYRCEACHVAR
jgi:c(7)-type cytochrome triheme protein